MTFNDLTNEDKEYIKLIYFSEKSHKEKLEILTHKYGVTGRSIRNWWKNMELTPVDIYRLPKQLQAVLDRVIPIETDIVFVTSCQNKTMINEGQLNNMVEYADFIRENFGLNVEIVVIPTRYRNPTNPVETQNKKADEWWVHDVDQYLYYSKLEFGDCIISADSRVRPTDSAPLNGYEALAADNHLILGHSRLHLKVLPRFKGDRIKVMATTGYLSSKNYSRSKAGDKGHVHHTYGFTIIEKKKDGTCLPPRTVKCDYEGNFTDIIYHVSNEKVSLVDHSEALIWGDIHHAQLDEQFVDITYDLVEKLKPVRHIIHDLLDSESMNHHESKDMFIKKIKIKEGRNDIKKEVNAAIGFAQEIHDNTGSEVNVIQSNHDDFLDKHINLESWKKDLHNSEAYLEYALIQQSVDLRNYGNIFGYLISQQTSDDIRYIKSNESLRIRGYQCGYHGDHGVNGSRGNINTFKRLNTKMIHGHSHSPAIVDGVTCVGVTCKLWQYYNSAGMSSWAYAHSVIHADGKNQLLIFNDDYELSLLI